jgi:hypothetical protein
MKYAHYFASKNTKYVVISQDTSPVGFKIAVKGKAEARQVAKDQNATPWNF